MTLGLVACGVAVFGLILASVLLAVFKGSRPPQLSEPAPTATKQATFAAFVAALCALIPVVTFKFIDVYFREHLAVPKTLGLVIPFVGVLAPWLVGIYSAYKAARSGNKLLRAIGASEMLIFVLAAAFVLLSR